ncbi:DNA damage-regulated autophagy modulator protein 1 isoform X2 [Denticeps clupeoides]|uniref:CWH43-like N-terminal domain-containing protein n=1 Tax=Denticeps clupeoides TaxID=299321 RepID=A0AAY4DB89_9TELE|nr:DNA damage-regulated autophagy modulator protein 1 isoform X2 [Denticeps clupeoides]
MPWFTEGTCFLPVLLVISSSSTFIVDYVIALVRRDVDAIFPYISDTGTKPPESCVFGLMTSITAFAGLATMYARYKFLERLNEKIGQVPPTLNRSALAVGLIACFGMCMVATFQETVVAVVHDVGASTFFTCGMLYIVLQTIISFKAYPYATSKTVCWTRTILAVVAFVAVFPTIICWAFVKKNKLHWDPQDQDYVLHLISAVCEWTVAFSFVFFFLTYIREFKLFTLSVKAELQEHSQEY